jgi:AmiR/NasT family two-component response regulator
MTDLKSPSTSADFPARQHVRSGGALWAVASAVEAFQSARRADRASGDVQGHRLLGQAVGILMERYEVGEDRALHCLLRVADASQVELCEVARVVVDGVNARGRAY